MAFWPLGTLWVSAAGPTCSYWQARRACACCLCPAVAAPQCAQHLHIWSSKARGVLAWVHATAHPCCVCCCPGSCRQRTAKPFPDACMGRSVRKPLPGLTVGVLAAAPHSCTPKAASCDSPILRRLWPPMTLLQRCLRALLMRSPGVGSGNLCACITAAAAPRQQT